jgi:hypothetical protein
MQEDFFVRRDFGGFVSPSRSESKQPISVGGTVLEIAWAAASSFFLWR